MSEEKDLLQRDIGRMESEIKTLQSTLEEVRQDLKAVKQAFHELKGGTKFLMSAAAACGAIIAIAIEWFSKR